MMEERPDGYWRKKSRQWPIKCQDGRGVCSFNGKSRCQYCWYYFEFWRKITLAKWQWIMASGTTLVTDRKRLVGCVIFVSGENNGDNENTLTQVYYFVICSKKCCSNNDLKSVWRKEKRGLSGEEGAKAWSSGEKWLSVCSLWLHKSHIRDDH